MTTAVVYHEGCLKHRQLPGHPETPERLKSTMEYYAKKGVLDHVRLLKPENATLEDILRVHDIKLVEHIRELAEGGGGSINSDTYVSPETYDAALLTAGGVKLAGEVVMTGEYDNAFALVRPPGHHASRYEATGFCYFDNVSVMIKYLQQRYGLKRALVFDWDAHNPNGTMDTFYHDPTVLNVSIHQDPHTLYPGTGFVEDIGEGSGRGYTINLPVPAGTGDADYMHLIDEVITPAAERFRPELIVLSAGQDSHRDDLLSGLSVTEAGYAAMTMRFMELAEEHCNRRLVVELEGGYNLNALRESNYMIISALMGMKFLPNITGKVRESTKELVKEYNEVMMSARIWADAPRI
ncbi:MAG: histone deacetylase [Candidatus Altiarchaeota archaeon]